jgi:hypothetical protein
MLVHYCSLSWFPCMDGTTLFLDVKRMLKDSNDELTYKLGGEGEGG